MSDSIFTKIIKREIPAEIVYENDSVLAFKDIDPKAPVHILIIPKKQIPTINDAKTDDAELLGNIILAAKEIAKTMNIDENGYRLVFNCNKDAGQTVFHVHCHLLGGRPLNWPPG